MRYLILLFISFSFHVALYSQVIAHVDVQPTRDFNETNLNITWSASGEERWMSENENRLHAMALKTDLAFSSLPVADSIRSVFRITLQRKGLIELLIESKEWNEAERLEIIDDKTGKIIFSTHHFRNASVLTPVFDANTARLEWTSGNESHESGFVIKSIFIHENLNERSGPTIGFNTALPCHPNAACKDSVLRMLSNSAMRIRMVMEEGIGWCTGSFVNNTRNDKTPYVLLAYHCTFAYTPRYDLWRFDLEYRADSCPNPAVEPVRFSMEGCERIAGGQASDFLLVLLNEDLPINQEVTFAGWNRDDNAIPDTTYLVHHPNADIRKISTSTNQSVIHPNQIGWSEGYTTPANHHFRFKFTEGGHQPGSSGGPVFNQDGKLVAQLHGGILGCEEENNAFAGRISKSWNLGATPQERLSDWLDPDATGETEIPSIENFSQSDIIDIRGTIKDPGGNPVNNVTVKVSGSVEATLTTNGEGEFVLGQVNRNGQYHLVPVKETNPSNGVSAIDLLLIQKHVLLKDTFDMEWQRIAADATNSGTISVGDIVILLKLLLGRITDLPTSPSWRFSPSSLDISSLPAGEPLRLEIQGIKIGDVNGTADPAD